MPNCTECGAWLGAATLPTPIAPGERCEALCPACAQHLRTRDSNEATGRWVVMLVVTVILCSLINNVVTICISRRLPPQPAPPIEHRLDPEPGPDGAQPEELPPLRAPTSAMVLSLDPAKH